MTNQKLITDAIHDEDTGHWFKVTGEHGSHWFSMEAFDEGPLRVIPRIKKETGHLLSVGRLRRQLEAEMEALTPRSGIVARQVGWMWNSFITGDGQVVPDRKEVDIIAALGLPKFRAAGSLADWQVKLTPFVQGQTLPLFAIALALSGAVIRFLPGDHFNPMIDFVGKKATGKSTLGAVAASVWAGNPAAAEGGGENWNMTPNAFDIHRERHRDMLLFLDEAEGSGITDRERMSFAKRVIFTGATTKGKVRMTDTVPSPDALRSAFLSTSNTPITELLRTEPIGVQEAASSRLLTIKVGTDASDGMPALDALPAGFDSMQNAVGALRRAVDDAYGTAGPALVHSLADRLRHDETTFHQDIIDRLNLIDERLRRICPAGDVRHRRILATIELAGTLAQENSVVPSEWGAMSTVIDEVFLHLIANPSDANAFRVREQERFTQYVTHHRRARNFLAASARLIPGGSVRRSVPGFICTDRSGHRELLIDPEFFKRTFDSADHFVLQARKDGRLRVNKSEPDRRQIHAPAWMRRYGFSRVFAIRLQ